MDTKKIVTFSLIFIMLLAVATVIIAQMKPQMHKMIMFEQIIFKRSTK